MVSRKGAYPFRLKAVLGKILAQPRNYCHDRLHIPLLFCPLRHILVQAGIRPQTCLPIDRNFHDHTGTDHLGRAMSESS